MLEPIKHILNAQRTILASASPRRSEILHSVGLKFTVMTSNFAEDLTKEQFSHPCEYVKETAKQKALEVWRRLTDAEPEDQRPDLVIAADTVVTLDDEIIEKPVDRQDAMRMLEKLSGRKHNVYTGVSLITKSEPTNGENPALESISASGSFSLSETEEKDYLVTTFHEGTEVHFAELTPAIITSYVNTGEPLDKAGAYGIQGIGGTLIESIKGDFFNVMGLPLHRLSKELYHLYTEKDK